MDLPRDENETRFLIDKAQTEMNSFLKLGKVKSKQIFQIVVPCFYDNVRFADLGFVVRTTLN